MLMLSRRKDGFTIVELLITIVVIATLASIAVIGYTGIQNRAKATAITVGIRDIEKAMNMTLLLDDATEWWDDDDYEDATGESTLKYLIDNTNLRNFLSSVPKVGPDDNSFWMYDNDPSNDAYDPTVCPATNRSDGVNIQIELANNARLAQQLDDMLDDGDLACGRFRQDDDNPHEYLWLLATNYRHIGEY